MPTDDIVKQRQAIREGLAERHYRHEYDAWSAYAGYRWKDVPDHYEGKQHSYKAADATLAFLTEKGAVLDLRIPLAKMTGEEELTATAPLIESQKPSGSG